MWLEESTSVVDNNIEPSIGWSLEESKSKVNVNSTFIATVLIILITLLNIIVYYLRKHHDETRRSSSDHQSCHRFSLAQIKSATLNFDEALVVGKGGFGKVYKGTINDPESIVAIKRLDIGSKQGPTEFWTEIEMLSKFRHRHLVSLLGYCDDYQEMIIVYVYLSAGSLRDHLHKVSGSHCTPFNLPWLQRLKICIGAARGLDYLHSETSIQQGVIHRDVKSSNILLDENWVAKISDFGLSIIGPANEDCTHVSTHVKGSPGYLDPDYCLTHRVSTKSDVYSLGVVLLEVLCGRPAVDLKLDEEKHSLVRWAKSCIKEGKLDQMIDPSLKGQILATCLKEFVQVANQCLHNQPRKRPTMAEIVVRLEFALSLQERTDFSVLEGEFTVGAYDNQGNMDSFPRDGGEHQEKQSNGYTWFDGARSGQKSTFIGKVRSLLLMKTSVLPESRPITSKSNFLHQRSAGSKALKRWSKLKREGIVRGLYPTLPDLNSKEGLQCRRFSVKEIISATQNFNKKLVIGEGGFGKVYKGIIDNGATTVAIKRLESWSKQGASEFWTEIEMLSKFRHSHLVSLIGYCNEKSEMIIVYEYMSGGTLAENLHKSGSSNLPLSWEQRLKICLGAARGLDYLHTGTSILTRVIHRDVKSSNILLDVNGAAKVADFGLSKIGPAEQLISHVSTNVKGTLGYVDPEYILKFRLTRKSDVYAFGVVMFEALCGRSAVDCRVDEEQIYLATWAKHCIKKKRLQEIVDPHLRGSILADSLVAFAEIAEQCLHSSSRKRPTMAEVIARLEYVLSLQEETNYSLKEEEIISNGSDYENQEGDESDASTEA